MKNDFSRIQVAYGVIVYLRIEGGGYNFKVIIKKHPFKIILEIF